jgi:hypothetical protein
MDIRLLSAPGGTVLINDPLYIERKADAFATAIASATGELLIIRGARQRGKSSLSPVSNDAAPAAEAAPADAE